MLSSILLLNCTQKKESIVSLPYYNEPTFTPMFIKDHAEIDKEITHKIDDFSFLDQDSVLINQKVFDGKIHIANFIFTSCGSICPTMIDNMKIVSNAFPNDKNLVFLSYSVTPWIDNPASLKKFKTKNKITNQNWHFLTGNKGNIYQLARKSYFAEEDIGFSKDSTEFLHTEHFVLVDKNKRIRGIYNGTLSLEMEQLVDDLKNLKSEK